MKKCTQCGELKSLTLFSRQASMNDGLRAQCKACDTARSITYYHAHKPSILARAKKYASEHKPLIHAFRARIREQKYALVLQAKSRPCMDCGHSFLPFVMDLDHVRGKKLFGLSACRFYSVAAIKTEIEKCDIVCSNCHRLRTWARKTEGNHEEN
jgi:hypothetical protein